MYYEEKGKENLKTVIFIHGAMWPRSFCRQEVLSDRYHTVFFQMNGHGKEYDHRFEREEILKAIVDFIKDNNIIKPHILGFSLGTQIAMQIADRYPDLIDKVALISPLTNATDEDIARIKFTMKTLANLVKVAPFLKIAARVLSVEENCKSDFIEEMKSQKVEELAEDIMKERLNIEDLPNLQNIENEFYIAVGLKDAECFIETGKRLKKLLKNSVFAIFEKCGHNIPIISYNKLNSDLKLFFGEKKIRKPRPQE